MLSRDEEVWMRAFEATINCIGVTTSMALKVADECLEDFKKRFPNKPPVLPPRI